MTCPECGLEMMIYQVVTGPDGTESVEYVCRNKRCGRYDRRLTRPRCPPSSFPGGLPAAGRYILRETGWFRGMDGKWRFEIDDSAMEYRANGDARLLEEGGYRRLDELTEKWVRNAEGRGNPLTADELAESEQLESEYFDRVWAEK